MTAAPEAFTSDPTARERSISFEAVFNVRDLGGLPAADGRTTRSGRLFRADGVQRLAGSDLDQARELRLRTVIDLRTEGEIERSGRFPLEQLPVDWHHLPLIGRMWSDDELVATTGAVDFLRDRYLDMLDEGADSIARVIRLVAGGTPAMFHCAAGKDRTGVVAAVILGLLDVSHQEIATDYHATAGAMAAFVDWLTLAHPEAIDAMTSQPPEYLEAPIGAITGFLETVEDRYGSMQGLATHLGVSSATIDMLRTELLE